MAVVQTHFIHGRGFVDNGEAASRSCDLLTACLLFFAIAIWLQVPIRGCVIPVNGQQAQGGVDTSSQFGQDISATIQLPLDGLSIATLSLVTGSFACDLAHC